jgi:hypothetical protein
VARAPSLAWLTQLTLSDCTFSEPAALDAVVDAVLARGISTLVLRDCRFAPHSELALARALGGAALTTLEVECGLGDAGMARVCDALRDNSHLKTLRCGGNSLPNACLERLLLDALRTNTSLRCLKCDGAEQAVALVRSRR